MTEFPSRARVVIIGGGIVGCSTAYHLTKLGWTDVVLIEQGQLSSGTTWHAAGLVGQLRATESGTRLVQYGAQLYSDLEAETGLATGFKRCGGVTVARTPDRMIQLERTAASAEAYGLECELITPQRAQELYPILEIGDLVGGIWLPGDGTANPTDTTQSLAKGARMRGAQIFEKTRVTAINVRDGRVTGVVTDRGELEAEYVVNCAGQWGHAIGKLAGVTIPLHSAEHFYVVSEKIDGVHPMLPILRDPDGYTYFKEEVGGLVIGGFEPEAKPWVSPDDLPYPFEFQLLQEDWDHFSVIMESALERIPVLNETGIKKFYNGPESFTPDNQFILGEAPEVKNFFVGCGFNSVGIASAGGAGRALAEWIVNGEPTSDLTAVDIRRFAPFHNDHSWLKARVVEILGLHYAVPWPNRELETARPLRMSPVYEHLKQANAVFGSKMGWERANVFAPAGHEANIEYAWGMQNWVPWSAEEQRATRHAVAVFDETSFGKLRISGSDAESFLQWMCTNNLAVEPGKVVYTGLLNSRGGYEADVTITRESQTDYLYVTSSASAFRDLDWLRRHIDGRDVVVTDVTDDYTVLGVMGPKSREVLQAITDADFGNDAFPFATSQVVTMAGQAVRATRITYVGELGWELYIPNAVAAAVYEAIMQAGAAHGVRNAGYYALNALRLEKGYRAWPAELSPDYTPLDAGLLFACKLKSDIPFLGRDALEAHIAKGADRTLVSVVLDNPNVMMWGGELVLRDGAGVGQITSAAWAAETGACVALAYVRGAIDGRFEVNVGGQRCPARVSTQAPYDPANSRIR